MVLDFNRANIRSSLNFLLTVHKLMKGRSKPLKWPDGTPKMTKHRVTGDLQFN
jgi:hypothetical protein